MVGGALKDTNSKVWTRIVQAGGGSKSKFGVITAGSIPASQDPKANTTSCENSECNGIYYSKLLTKFGAGFAEWIPVDLDHKDAAEDTKLAEKVRGYTGFFIGGGDQSRYIDCLVKSDQRTDTAVLAAIRAAIKSGVGIAGTSAGTAIQQAGPMITGGESYYGIRDGTYSRPSSDVDRVTYRPSGGWGFFSGGLLDTHFGARGRHGRLIRLLSDTKNTIGFGIDEDTALIASNGTLSVMGTNNVNVFNLQDSSTGGSGSNWSIKRVRWSLLSDGDRIDAISDEVYPSQRARGNSKIGTSTATLDSTDIFSSPDNKDGSGARKHPYEIVKIAQNMIQAGYRTSISETFETNPIYRVRLTKGSSFQTWEAGADTVSFKDIEMEVYRS